MTRLRQLWLLTALASLAVLAGGYFLLVSPKASEAAKVRDEAETQLAANRKLASDIAMLKQQAKDLPKKQAELAQIGRQIPANPALPLLMRSLSDAADSSGSTLVSIAPAEPQLAGPPGAAAVAGPALAQIPLALEVRGTYSAITQFFSEIESMPRAFLVTGVNVTEAKDKDAAAGGGHTLTATLNGRVFMSATSNAAPVAPVKTTTTAK